MLLLKLQAQGRHGRSAGKGKKGALDEERWGPDLSRGCSGWSQGKGQPARGGVLVQGQFSYQTGGSLTDPANLPNYRGPGLQPRAWGALLTPRGEGIASQ